jgi:hypothetical protein
MKRNIYSKNIFFIALVLVFILILVSCNSKLNDKLTIEGKKYTISLGEIEFDDGIITISVLADGAPLPNYTVNTTSSISAGGETISVSSSSNQPVRMGLTVNDRYIFPTDMIYSSDDGKFMFYVSEMPEMIQVFTDITGRNTVYFDANTKEVIGPPVLKR